MGLKRNSIFYSLPVGDQKNKGNVCMKFFFQVLGLTRGYSSTIARSIDRSKDGILTPTKRGSYERTEDNRKTKLVRDHIMNFHLHQSGINSVNYPKQFYLDYRSGKFLGSKSKKTKIMHQDFLEKHPNKNDQVGYTKYFQILRKDVKEILQSNQCQDCAS